MKDYAHHATKARGGDAVYALGIFGALVYYLQHADGFWGFVAAIFQAVLWPAFMVYQLLGFIN